MKKCILVVDFELFDRIICYFLLQILLEAKQRLADSDMGRLLSQCLPTKWLPSLISKKAMRNLKNVCSSVRKFLYNAEYGNYFSYVVC